MLRHIFHENLSFNIFHENQKIGQEAPNAFLVINYKKYRMFNVILYAFCIHKIEFLFCTKALQ